MAKKPFDWKKYQKKCLYNFQANFVRGHDDDIIEHLAKLKTSKIKYLREIIRKDIGK